MPASFSCCQVPLPGITARLLGISSDPLIEQLKPAFFIMENVTNLKGVGGGLLYSDILERIQTIGYNLSVEALLAADFGAPQLRRRLIFLGCRKDIGTLSFPTPTHSEQDTLFFQPYITVRQAFAGLPRAEFSKLAPTQALSV